MRIIILDDCLERDLFIALSQIRSLETSLLLAHSVLRRARGDDSMSAMTRSAKRGESRSADQRAGPRTESAAPSSLSPLSEVLEDLQEELFE